MATKTHGAECGRLGADGPAAEAVVLAVVLAGSRCFAIAVPLLTIHTPKVGEKVSPTPSDLGRAELLS